MPYQRMMRCRAIVDTPSVSYDAHVARDWGDIHPATRATHEDLAVLETSSSSACSRAQVHSDSINGKTLSPTSVKE